jgi:hypothetical protein
MTATQPMIYQQLFLVRDDRTAMLDRLIAHFRETRQPRELFEALKMRVRHRLGLPLIRHEDEPASPEEVERQLELGLLDACREAGSMLIRDGKIGEGWMYLRPTGETNLAKSLISEIAITDENYDEMVQVLLHEGIDVARGFQAVLDHQGTCNSITLYEQSLAGRSRQDRMAAAGRLLDHLYDELTSLVRGEIARREAPADPKETLYELMEKRRWILADGGYHLDTTHLSATVRIASVLEDRRQLRRAWELTQYGRRLHQQFQYPGEEPFVDFYPAYSTFYSVLLGDNVESGLKVFQRKAQNTSVSQQGTGAIETYVDLLDRLGRHREAIEAAIELVPQEVPPQRLVPRLLEIAARIEGSDADSAYTGIEAYCENRGDLLGYAATLHAAASRE